MSGARGIFPQGLAMVASLALALVLRPGVAAAQPCSPIGVGGDFEGGVQGSKWEEYSSVFRTPLCTVGLCGTAGSKAGPRGAGKWWAWFGGYGKGDTSRIKQKVFLPAGFTANLSFYLWIGRKSGNGTDVLRVKVDQTTVLQILESDARFTAGYAAANQSLTAFADGKVHTLTFEVTTSGPTPTDFSVDDVVIQTCTSSCVYSLSASTGYRTASGGSSQFDVLTTPGCSWTATSGDPWLLISGGASGTGPGTVSYRVLASAEPQARTGSITAAGLSHLVTQPSSGTGREIRVLPTGGVRGTRVSVPVQLISAGGEYSVRFTLTFDPNVLAAPIVTLGGDDPLRGIVTVNSSQEATGKTGISITATPPDDGPSPLADVSFLVNPATVVTSTAIGFGDTPLARKVQLLNLTSQALIQDASASNGGVPIWSGGSMAISLYRDGDVNGDTSLDVFDLVVLASLLVGNVQPGVPPFVAPLLTADMDHNSQVDLFDLVTLAFRIVNG